GDVIAGLRQLYEHAEADRLSGQPRADLIEQEVLGSGRRLFTGEVLGPGFRSDAKPPVTAHTISVRELERRDGEERLPSETGRDRLRSFDKPLRVWVPGEKGSKRLGSARLKGCYGAEQFQELLGSADREAIGGVGDDVSVNVLGQVETDSHPP